MKGKKGRTGRRSEKRRDREHVEIKAGGIKHNQVTAMKEGN